MALGSVASGVRTDRKNAAGSSIAAVGAANRTKALLLSLRTALSTYRSMTRLRISNTPACAWPALHRSCRSGLSAYSGSITSKLRMLTPPIITVGRIISKIPATLFDISVILSPINQSSSPPLTGTNASLNLPSDKQGDRRHHLPRVEEKWTGRTLQLDLKPTAFMPMYRVRPHLSVGYRFRFLRLLLYHTSE